MVAVVAHAHDALPRLVFEVGGDRLHALGDLPHVALELFVDLQAHVEQPRDEVGGLGVFFRDRFGDQPQQRLAQSHLDHGFGVGEAAQGGEIDKAGVVVGGAGEGAIKRERQGREELLCGFHCCSP